MRKTINWLDDKALKQIYTSDYWNDINEEKKKAWWIEDGNYKKCLDYLKNYKLLDEFNAAIGLSGLEEVKNGIVVDLAAGIAWTSALMTKFEKVDEVHAVEISKHRIDLLAPHAFKMLSGNENKFHRYIGSFYDLQLPENYCDFIFMSQAFHHAEKPFHLLLECNRILKKEGKIILIGEHYYPLKRILRQKFGLLRRGKKITGTFFEDFPTHPILGDHYYRPSDYQLLFGSIGFEIKIKYLPEVKRAVIIASRKI